MQVDRRKDDSQRARIDQALEVAATEAATKAATKAGRTTARRAAGGYFALLFVLLVGVFFYQQSTNKRLNDSELRACERVQLQRERTNVSEARQYLLLDTAARSPRAAEIAKERYRTLSRTTLYDPPTDCPSAVSHPGTYKRPPSIALYATPRGFADSIVKAAKEKQPQPTLTS